MCCVLVKLRPCGPWNLESDGEKERNGEKRRDEKNSKKNEPSERSENDKLEQIAKNRFFISRFTGFII